MKKILVFLAVLYLSACQNDKSVKSFYQATKDDTVALISLVTKENRFYGNYEIRYDVSLKDSGEIRGERLGDTLVGRFKYVSSNGAKKIVPFVLLKRDQAFIEGRGPIWTYLNIPYFNNSTLQFKDSNFKFYPIDVKAAENLGIVK